MPKNPTSNTQLNNGKTLFSSELITRTGDKSKNYEKFGTMPKVNGRQPVLVSNDGTVYVDNALAASVPAGAKLRITVTVE